MIVVQFSPSPPPPSPPSHPLFLLVDSLLCLSSGIPTLILAAASMDDVIAISLFGVFLGLAFSEGKSS